MNLEAVEYIIRRCQNLLKRPSGTSKVKNEYHYWVNWLNKELKNFKKLNELERLKIKTLIDKNKELKKDLLKF